MFRFFEEPTLSSVQWGHYISSFHCDQSVTINSFDQNNYDDAELEIPFLIRLRVDYRGYKLYKTNKMNLCIKQVCENQQNDLQLLHLNLESSQERLQEQEERIHSSG